MKRANWVGRTAVVLASGPSLSDEQLDLVQEAAGRWMPFKPTLEDVGALVVKPFVKVIAVNNTAALAPWADVGYFGDYMALRQYLPELRRSCGCEWWTASQAGAQRWQINLAKSCGKPGLGTERVHLNGNSGFQAINLATLFGAHKVLLLGFDMRPGADGRQHWFGEHPAPLVQTCLFDEWLHKARPMAEDAKAQGIDIVNVTPGSALDAFRRGNLEEELS